MSLSVCEEKHQSGAKALIIIMRTILYDLFISENKDINAAT